jgi:hypothetical protein
MLLAKETPGLDQLSEKSADWVAGARDKGCVRDATMKSKTGAVLKQFGVSFPRQSWVEFPFLQSRSLCGQTASQPNSCRRMQANVSGVDAQQRQ